MILRGPFFQRNNNEDQPYYSLLFIAPSCDLKCGSCCHNSQLMKKNKIKNWTKKEIKQRYEVDFFEGITIGGLEVTCSNYIWLKELCQIIEVIQIPNVTIYTREELTHPKIKFLIDNINTNLYIKTGMYIPNMQKKTVTIGDWEIELASDNQNFQKVK
jgi:hypothetical protein